MQLALILCYPLSVHLGVVFQQNALQVLALGLLAAGMLYPGLRRASPGAWLALAAAVVVAVALGRFDAALFALYLPPVLFPLAILAVFARTLRPGETPLVTAIGLEVHGQLPPALLRYTRWVTGFWVGLLAAQSSIAAALAIFASPALWSLFSNVLSYALVAGCFLAEYAYRRWRFRDFRQPGLGEYLGIVLRAGIGRRAECRIPAP